MALGQYKRAVGVFRTRRDAEYALHELRDSGFPMDKVSVVARDADRDDEIAGADVRDRPTDTSRDRSDNQADLGATKGAITGGALGGLTGLLVGLGILAIPGIGPVMLAGATATTIATTLSGTAIGAVTGGLLGALVGLGIPEEKARVYNERVSRGEYLVIVDGRDEEIGAAEAILHRRGIQEWGIYDAPGVDTAPTDYATSIAPTTGVADAGIARNKYAVGYFPHRRDAEIAVKDLRNAGFPLNQVTLVAQNFEQPERFAGVEMRDRFDAMRMGLPDERARFYNDRVTRGEYVVIVNGTEDEVHRAMPILGDRGLQEWAIFDPTAINSQSVAPTPTATSAFTGGNTLNHRRRAIGVFPHYRDAEAALRELRDSGFDTNNVSVIAKHADRDDTIAGAEVSDRVGTKAGNKADEGAKAGAATGGALGGLTGLLVGLGTLAIPGVGPILLGGATATALATTLAGGAIGATAGGLSGALVGLGVPDDRAKIYNDRVGRGDYLVIVDGTEDEIAIAQSILNRHGIQEFSIYDAASGVDTTRGNFNQSDRDYHPAVDTTHADSQVVSQHPEVVIIDRRNETI